MNVRFIYLLLLFLATAGFGTAQEATQLSPVQIAERNKPGTVLVEATFSGSVTTPNVVVDQKALDGLKSAINFQVNLGLLDRSRYWNSFIMSLCREPSKYLLKGREEITRNFSVNKIGSGFIITPEGHVITNCHVVDEADEVTQQQFAVQSLREYIEDDLKAWERAISRKLSEEEEKALRETNSWFFTNTMTVSEVKKEFKVLIGMSGPGEKIVAEKIPASLITKGGSIPRKDVAILKLNRGSNYPTIRLGDAEKMRIGEPVFALGYPAVATFHELLSEESVAEATLTRGIISARKTMKEGWEVLQTDAAITRGSSGGPVLNGNGEVIGLATFGSVDYQRQQDVQGMNFIVPSTIVEEFLARAGIKPEMSSASLAFEEAMEFFDMGWYRKALEKLEEVKQLNSGYPFVNKYLSESRDLVSKGADREPTGEDISKKDSFGMYLSYMYLGGGILIGIIIMLVIMLVKKNRSAVS